MWRRGIRFQRRRFEDITNKEQKAVEKLCGLVSQKVSYQLADMIMSYFYVLRPLVVATVQACITAQIPTMPESALELYETALGKMAVMTVPPALDPRKMGGEKS